MSSITTCNLPDMRVLKVCLRWKYPHLSQAMLHTMARQVQATLKYAGNVHLYVYQLVGLKIGGIYIDPYTKAGEYLEINTCGRIAAKL
jgi:hypothetical protein